MMKPGYFFLILLSWLGWAYPQDPRLNPDYLLAISDGYNYLEKKDYARAGSSVSGYLHSECNCADAYLIMGEIYLRKEFYRLAEEELAKAEKSRDYFILPEQVIRLYWDQVEALIHSQELLLLNPEQEIIVFDIAQNPDTEERVHRVLLRLIAYASQHSGDYYLKQLGRAYFMMGRVLYRTQPLKAMESFSQAANRGFLIKSANLYLAYFFAIQDQEMIDRIYQQDQKRHPPPNRRRAFLLYYQNYQETEEDEELRRSLIPDAEYAAMEYALDVYYRSLAK